MTMIIIPVPYHLVQKRGRACCRWTEETPWGTERTQERYIIIIHTCTWKCVVQWAYVLVGFRDTSALFPPLLNILCYIYMSLCI
jgi:hypothetical protein